MFNIPIEGSAAREAMGDIAHVAEVLNPKNVGKLKCFREAIADARRAVLANPGVKSVNVICIRGDDERWLISVGPRGGWKKIWNFGRG